MRGKMLGIPSPAGKAKGQIVAQETGRFKGRKLGEDCALDKIRKMTDY
jgi:hypothetical protein